MRIQNDELHVEKDDCFELLFFKAFKAVYQLVYFGISFELRMFLF